jgi:membrane protein YdbS with pleckstrin-like domain
MIQIAFVSVVVQGVDFMAYIDELLGRGEQILYIGRQHVFVLISNILAELGLIAILIAAGVWSQNAFSGREYGAMQVGQLVLLGCGVISFLVLLSAFFDYIRWNNEEYVVTDHRVIQVRGILNKKVVDSSLEKINDVELHQSWLGRIFDFGDIEILTAADTGVGGMRKIARPLDFKRAMLEAKQEQIRGYRGYLEPSVEAYIPSNAPSQDDIERTLRKLVDLRDQGLLSQAEFEAKKRELLSRI